MSLSSIPPVAAMKQGRRQGQSYPPFLWITLLGIFRQSGFSLVFGLLHSVAQKIGVKITRCFYTVFIYTLGKQLK
jgi:hypothetical protein